MVAVRSWRSASGWSISQAHQDQSYQNGTQPESNPDSLQRAESVPLPRVKDVDRRNADDAEDTEDDDEDAELTFGDHGSRGSGFVNEVSDVSISGDYSIRMCRCNSQLERPYW